MWPFCSALFSERIFPKARMAAGRISNKTSRIGSRGNQCEVIELIGEGTGAIFDLFSSQKGQVFTKPLWRDFSMACAGYQCRRSVPGYLDAQKSSKIKIKDMKIFQFSYFDFLQRAKCRD